MSSPKCMSQRWLILSGLVIVICILSVSLYLQAASSDMLVSDLFNTEYNHSETYGMNPVKDQQQHCIEKRHIVYIKVSKTGSSTLSSIFIRFGLERNLTFALPSNGSPRQFGKRLPLEPDHIAPIAVGDSYDMLVHHSTYNHTTVQKVFPKDTVVIASLREPFSRFVSAFNYYDSFKRLYSTQKLSFTEKLKLYINTTYTEFKTGKKMVKSFNIQSWRLAVPEEKFYDVTFIRDYISNELDRNLELVLVQEYFDESLVLMKRFLCWELSDVIYLSTNVKNSSTGLESVNSSQVVSRFKALAVPDYMIYDHFYSKFWATVKKEGMDFFGEVRAFKDLQLRVSSFCNKQLSFIETVSLPSTRWSGAFKVTGKTCSAMKKRPKILTVF